ncbi:hypothetical protein N5C72_07745 [Achromobacter mucicolens]|uniref:Uncharacterized protein n=1 Tax=Achromobacter mucicolens TaxID=1389922 RepID=A0ABD4YS15_9BURK|nr:hypothetical protein [Achromobacter mucicolens]MDH1177963.1 hypothetical protein [Achromobacter mucicolens]
MSKIKDGGPAFPVPNYIKDLGTGLTLRDYFAAKAMQTLEPPVFYVGTRETQESLGRWARQCLQMADAMLAARGAQ